MAIAAATVSSQQARVKGEISPIRRLSLLITAIEVSAESESEIRGNVDIAGLSWWIVSVSLVIMFRSSMVNVGMGEKTPMAFRRKRKTSSRVNQQCS